VLNFAESSAADCRSAVGILVMLMWALAEIHRLSATAVEPRAAGEFAQPVARSGVLSGLTPAFARISSRAKAG
jgi:hypothetical protein